MNEIIETAASVAECCIYVRLCNGFLGFKNKKYKWLKSCAFFAVLFVNGFFLTQINNYSDIAPVIDIFLFLIYSFVFMKGKAWEKILAAVIPTVTAFPVSMTAINIFSALAGNNRAEALVGGSMRLYVLFFSKTALLVITEILIKSRKQTTFALSRCQQIIRLSCFFISFIITSIIWNISRKQDENAFLYAVIFMLIAFLNILLYVLMCKMQKNYITKEEYNLLKTSLFAQEKLAFETKERYIEMRALRHDIKHCFTALAALISDNKPDEAMAYIENIVKQQIAPAVTGINTESAVIDAAVNSKISLAAKKGIAIKCMIDVRFIEINDVDISILLSNLLDNAIEGCDLSDPNISLDMETKGTFIYIAVKNKIASSVLKDNPELKTIKKDKREHGFGIKSIKSIAEKYNGNVEFNEKNGYFVAQVWINSEK